MFVDPPTTVIVGAFSANADDGAIRARVISHECDDASRPTRNGTAAMGRAVVLRQSSSQQLSFLLHVVPSPLPGVCAALLS